MLSSTRIAPDYSRCARNSLCRKRAVVPESADAQQAQHIGGSTWQRLLCVIELDTDKKQKGCKMGVGEVKCWLIEMLEDLAAW